MENLQKAIMEIIEKGRIGKEYNYFNPLYFWGEYKEVPHSSVIGALLDPKENWSCKKGYYSTLFLESFIRDVLEINEEIKFDEVQIITESATKSDSENGKNGRIDIEIKLNDDTSILIENKVKANLDPGQLAKYYRDHKATDKKMVYLSLYGEDSLTEDSLKVMNKPKLDRDKVKCITYEDIANWLKDCLSQIHENNSLKQGVQIYLDTVYNILEDERSQYSLWKNTYLELFKYIDKQIIDKKIDEKNITKELNEIENDKENWIASLIDMVKRREDLKSLYNQLSQKLPNIQLYLSYEDVEGQQHNDPIKNLDKEITEILCQSSYWIGFSICIYHSQEECNVYHSLQTYNEQMWVGLAYEKTTDMEFDQDTYRKDKKISFIEVDENRYEYSLNTISSFCTLTNYLINDFNSFDTCKKYLNYANGAIVFENVMNFFKESNIFYTLKHSTNKIDLALYNHDWWLIFGEFALGYGAGSMWLYTDKLDFTVKLKKIGFKEENDKNYGGKHLAFIFSYFDNGDTIDEKDVPKLTKEIISKIKEILNI